MALPNTGLLVFLAVVVAHAAPSPARTQAPAPELAEAAAAMSQADAFERADRHPDAEPLYRRALALRETALGPDHPDTAASVEALALALEAQGRLEEAEPLLRHVVAVDAGSLGPPGSPMARHIENLAELLRDEGRYAEAEPLRRRALAIYDSTLGPDHPQAALALDNLALSLHLQGRDREAEPMFRRAMHILEKSLGEEHIKAAIPARNLANLLVDQGRYHEVEGLFRRVLRVDEAQLGPGHPQTGVTLNDLAAALMDQDRYAEAEPIQRRALAILEHALGPDHPDTASGLEGLARLFADQGRFVEAEPLLKRVVAIREARLGRGHPETVAANEALGLNELQQANFADAVARYRLACPRHVATAGLVEPADEAAKARRARSSGCFASLALALRGWFEQGGGEAPGDRPGSLTAEAFEAAQRAIQSAAGDALSRSAALTAAASRGAGKMAADYETTLGELGVLAEDFAKAAVEPGAGGVETRAALAKARGETQTRLADLSASLQESVPLYWTYRSPQPVSVAALQAAAGADAALLRDGEGLVLWMVPPGQDHGLVFALGKTKLAWARLGVSGDELRASVAKLRAQIEARRRRFDRQAAFRLYEALLGDPAIQAVIAGPPVILFVPSGPLNSLPPGLLVTAPPEGGEEGDTSQATLRATSWLLRAKAVALLPAVASLVTLRELIPAHRPIAADPMLVFADPDFAGPNAATAAPGMERGGADMAGALKRLPRLPGTRMEGEALEMALGGRSGSLLLGAEASKAQLMDRNADGRLGDVRVLEFATHGLVAGAASWLHEPALVMSAAGHPADQLLLASEAATLRLNADWVLLSACDTASPDAPEAEGLSGLSRAFFFAGARSLLISHWPIRDDIAARLIPATLVAERSTAGLPRAQALRRATLAILDDPALHAANPVSWAPFTLVGEPDR